MNDIFNVSNLLESNFVKPTNVEKVNIKESYFLATLSYLEEMDAQSRDITKDLYKAVLEAGNDQIAINESFSTFTASIRKLIDKFIEWINKITQRFILALNKMVKSDKYIEKNKSKLDKFRSEDKFEMKIFNYTYLMDDEVPLLKPEAGWKTSTGLGNEYDTSSVDLLTGVTNFYNNFKDNLEGNADDFRAKVLVKCNRNSIDTGDFAEELFMLFRDGATTKSDEDIHYDNINQSYNRFKGYDKNISNVSNNKRDMEKGYGDIKREINSWFSNIGGKTPLDIIYNDANSIKDDYAINKKEVDEQINLFIKLKMNQIDSMTKIHALAFSAKLDAIKECYIQDKKILYKALSLVVKESTEMEDN